MLSIGNVNPVKTDASANYFMSAASTVSFEHQISGDLSPADNGVITTYGFSIQTSENIIKSKSKPQALITNQNS